MDAGVLTSLWDYELSFKMQAILIEQKDRRSYERHLNIPSLSTS